jgi:hypothetical protein
MRRRRKPRIGKVTSEADARPADDLPTKAILLRDLAARPAARHGDDGRRCRPVSCATAWRNNGAAGEPRCRWPT